MENVEIVPDFRYKTRIYVSQILSAPLMDNPFLTALYPCRLTEMQNHSDNKLCAINIMPICHMCSSSGIRKNILDKDRTILHCYFSFVWNVLYFIFVSVAEKGVILNIWKILQSWQKIKKQMELCACFVR